MLFCAPSVSVLYNKATPHSVFVFVAVTKSAAAALALSTITKFLMVIKSAPISLKIASLSAPEVKPVAAVMVWLPPSIVMLLVAEIPVTPLQLIT